MSKVKFKVEIGLGSVWRGVGLVVLFSTRIESVDIEMEIELFWKELAMTETK